MAINQMRKYIWLLDILRRKGKITFKELNELWLDDEISGGVAFSIRTFHKWRIAIEDLFGISIENEGRGAYRYYIGSSYAIDNNPFYSWLIDTVALENLMMSSIALHERILLEPTSSKNFLPTVISAMKEGITLRVTYKAFWQDSEKTILLEPYCVKQFKQRWYLLGRHARANKLLIYALDRVLRMEKEESMRFKLPADFSAKAHFAHAYGIITGDDIAEETVVLRVTEWHARYLRSLPLHHSQAERASADGYSVFAYRLCPTLDFQQEILSMGAAVEVMSPQWLREEMASQIKSMNDKYIERLS